MDANRTEVKHGSDKQKPAVVCSTFNAFVLGLNIIVIVMNANRTEVQHGSDKQKPAVVCSTLITDHGVIVSQQISPT